jgi:hypothetical protein
LPQLSRLLIAQLPQQLKGGPRRPWLVGVEATQAGDPIAGCRLAVAFPDLPRHGQEEKGNEGWSACA